MQMPLTYKFKQNGDGYVGRFSPSLIRAGIFSSRKALLHSNHKLVTCTKNVKKNVTITPGDYINRRGTVTTDCRYFKYVSCYSIIDCQPQTRLFRLIVMNVLQFTVCILSLVCNLHFTFNLHFIPSLQSAFFIQFAFYPWFTISLHFAPSLQSAFYLQSVLSLVCSPQFVTVIFYINR